MTGKEKVRGRKIGIIGMARSGMSAAKLIKRLGGIPFVSDSAAAQLMQERVEELKKLGIEFETGGHTERLLESEYAILSPGVPKTIEIVQRMMDQGIPVFPEIELASWFCRGKIIAITGSNGKTTTTTLIGEMLHDAGIHCQVCGNIGRPFTEVVEEIDENGFAVVEVSSFQLELVEQFKPHIALILNLTPDHLDRYLDFEDYKAAKYRIAENMDERDWLILNADDPEINGEKIRSSASRIRFSIHRTLSAGVFQRGKTLVGSVGDKNFDILESGEIRIPGPHNLQNAAAASLAALLAGANPGNIAETLRKFPGVEHRLEDAGMVAGIRFINDSKATNVDSVRYALMSINTPIVLIAGGRDKAGDFRPLIEVGKGRIKEIILIGEAREKMFDVLGKDFPIQFGESMEDAVRKAYHTAGAGETVLLSPACASFDMFDNFEHRGRVFKQAVAALENNNNHRKEKSMGIK